MSNNSEDQNYQSYWENPTRTPRGMAKITQETVDCTRNCCEHELNCGVDVYCELLEDLTINNEKYLGTVKTLSQLLGMHPSSSTPKMNLPSIYVGAIVGYALQRRAEEDSNERNLSLGKRIGIIDRKLKKIFENLEGSLGENLVKENLEENLKELKYSIEGLAVDYIGQESYARSLEKEKENLREEISDKDNYIRYLSEILEDNLKELEILRNDESILEKKARKDFFKDSDC